MEKPIALAADHGGYELKEAVKQHLAERAGGKQIRRAVARHHGLRQGVAVDDLQHRPGRHNHRQEKHRPHQGASAKPGL